MPFAHEKPAPSPYINRFLQPDSIIPSPANPQNWNRFSYVGNNPLRFNDPTGHCRADDNPDDCFTPGKIYKPSDFLDLKGYSTWERKILRKLYDEGGADATHGVEFMLAHDIHIKVGEPYRCGLFGCSGDLQSVGGVEGWYEGNDFIVLNPNKGYSVENLPGDWGLSTIIHEALHIEQGGLFGRASTKDSELEGFQTGLRVFMALEGKTFSQLPAYQRDMYKSTSGWDYAQKVKQYLPEYWWGLQLLPPYSPPYQWP
jgi:hypothetical protein